MQHLSHAHQSLHNRALKLSREHRRVESFLVLTLQEIDDCKMFKRLGYSSLFKYVVEGLGVSEPIAYALISVARKCCEVKALHTAVQMHRLSVSKASRIVSVVTSENADELIAFAESNSMQKINHRVAALNPRAASPDRAVPLSESLVKLEMTVSHEIYVKLLRVQSILSSKRGYNVGFEEALSAMLEEFVERNDPVAKANRAQARKASEKRASEEAPSTQVDEKLCLNRVSGRIPLTAAEKHAVFSRDGGRCTHVDQSGVRCESDRFLKVHHIIHVSHGGSNHPSNLTSLCSFHHDLVHQLSFPIDGQVTWLR